MWNAWKRHFCVGRTDEEKKETENMYGDICFLYIVPFDSVTEDKSDWERAAGAGDAEGIDTDLYGRAGEACGNTTADTGGDKGSDAWNLFLSAGTQVLETADHLVRRVGRTDT